MRQSKRMGKMKEERVRKLEELGFLWRCEQTGKVIWEEMIEKLKAFQARHGHCRVPVEWPEDPQLSAWVVYVRQRNRANNLSQEKVKELDAIQFVWTDVATAAAASNGSTAATTSNAQRRSDPGEADPGRPELLY
ncbi:helicase associated domain containing protein [Acanthamoeba castellanii str. Neff]|uniref:Helicase associated domain containing protein n=1 Tax=Acanthamoeba castellanii (strain ATCC 30010 / Neff) TaxID=1257118 RepID=L8H9D3_ACACF|nr:helicase associated domain containing protein [Acanthamoeba castellanii str. Neff]ELR21862.1 helicase associated domain containing protein [Acanthamoeba castellanii str. Neff]